MPRRRQVIIPTGVWQECRRSQRGKPPRCAGSYQENPCDHSWMVRVSAGTDSAGNRKRRAQAAPTLEDAAQLASDIAASTPSASGYDADITLGHWLDAWFLLKERQADALSPSTLPGYKTAIKIWKADRIARVKVFQLTFSLVNDALARMAEEQPRPEKRDFIDANGSRRRRAARHGKYVARRTPGTLRGYKRVLHAALEDARQFGLTTSNAAHGTMPAIGEAKAAKTQKIDITVPLRQRVRLDKWRPSETARFLNHIAGHRLSCLWKLYATIGPRRGELAGAGWFSYDHNLLAIESRLLAVAGPHPCEFCPVDHIGIIWQPGAKSGQGLRQIYLPTQLITAIAEHKQAQDAEKQAAADAGAPWWDHHLMFCREDGTPLRPGWITEEFERLIEQCQLPKIRLHDLRHNVASMLLAKGMPFGSVSKLTGHDEATLKQIYHHVVGEIVTPEIQAAYDWMESLQDEQQREDVNVTSLHQRRGA